MLTVKQKEILDYISQEEMDGHFPTYREIRDHFGLHSVSTVYTHIATLEKKGFLKKEGKARSFRVVAPRLNKFPLLGAVHAGAPTVAVEEIEGFLPLPVNPEAHPHAFLLRVKGDSMIDGHIQDGDLVVVDPDSQVRDGDICVAIIGDESTVKKLEKRRDGFYLVPMNDVYKEIYITRETQIVGKVIGLWRSNF
ncbi:MAG: transcriptional repressor LexA [Caldisericaceae bacterium]